MRAAPSLALWAMVLCLPSAWADPAHTRVTVTKSGQYSAFALKRGSTVNLAGASGDDDLTLQVRCGTCGSSSITLRIDVQDSAGVSTSASPKYLTLGTSWKTTTLGNSAQAWSSKSYDSKTVHFSAWPGTDL